MSTTLNNEYITCSIAEHGAELKSLLMNGREYLWQADPAFWGRTSPVLFPFVGGVNKGVYRVKETEYKMGQHGFARDMDFELVSSGKTECVFLLHSNEDTLAKYPYEFELYISYKLSGKTITVGWEVINTGSDNMYFSIGAHPAFMCAPCNAGVKLYKNGKELSSFVNSVFGAGVLTEQKANIPLSNGELKYEHHTFDGDAYVIEDSQTDRADLVDENGNVMVSVSYSAPLVGLWSPVGKDAPFICIEPWYGRADKETFNGDISEREWGNRLTPGESWSNEYTITLK